MRRDEIESWLREEDEKVLALLYREADEVRQRYVGDEVHLRGLVEISNHCARRCAYCGLRVENRGLTRYRMESAEIVECARLAERLGYGTIVLQAGEDFRVTGEWLANVVRRIKSTTSLAVTLSMGERSDADLAMWREAGADRYLLRFETSDAALFAKIHPPLGGADARNRIEILRTLRSLGYETGGGVMIGIPGQSYTTLARDIELFRELDLDMIGVGPYIAHPATPLGRGEIELALPPGEQVPNTEQMAYKTVALTRLVRPDANIPATTALATLNARNGRETGLERGANVIMPNLTPPAYRVHYEIYPNKVCFRETADERDDGLQQCLRAISRRAGEGQGGRRRSVAN